MIKWNKSDTSFIKKINTTHISGKKVTFDHFDGNGCAVLNIGGNLEYFGNIYQIRFFLGLEKKVIK